MVAVPGFDIPIALILIGCGIIAIFSLLCIIGYKSWKKFEKMNSRVEKTDKNITKKLKNAEKTITDFTSMIEKVMIDVPILPPHDAKDMKARLEAYDKYMKGDRGAMKNYWKEFYAKTKM